MGFLPGSLDKSVFNQGTMASAIGKPGSNGYAVVRIQPNSNRLGLTLDKGSGKRGGDKDPAIKGVFDFDKGGFSFDVEANWQSLGEIGSTLLPDAASKISDLGKKFNAGANLAGVAEVGSGLASQLIYQKSGHLAITVPMMIVDWSGEGQPVLSSLLLSRYCLPTYLADGKSLAQQTSKALENIFEKMRTNKDASIAEKLAGEAAKLAREGVDAVKEIAGKLAKGVADWVPATKELATAALDNMGGEGVIGDIYTLRSSPSDVTLEIGQFFRNPHMVITGVSFEFSKQMTRNGGPLFVNINVSLKSRRILTSVDDIGLKLPGGNNGRYLELGTNATGI